MNRVMTREEMETEFDEEWVLIEDPYDDERKQVAGGRVVFHSKNRDEVDAAAIRLRLKNAAFFYFGEMPKNAWINRGLFIHE